MVDKSVPPADFAAIQKTVENAAGIDSEARRRVRGLPARLRQGARAAEGGPVPVSLLGPLKWVGLGLATLLFLFFMRRALKGARARRSACRRG